MPISYFQFENLIRSRVPFVLFSWGFEFKGWFKNIEQMHLEQVLRRADQIALLLPELQKNLEQPIVLVCRDGKESKAQMEKLEAVGFKNVYFVLGGYSEMENDRSV